MAKAGTMFTPRRAYGENIRHGVTKKHKNVKAYRKSL